ncbi:substrate-binding domain-containing protein [Actinoplanes sp. NPDC024001]|uniref:substrate-binding domain-containing protein n=1 Tax=Actinoplanes sp. NPDC024001 TaxID=3154598 RepID=UPI0033DCA737
MAIVVVISGAWLTYQQFADSGCTGSVRLSVAAAPEIAPAVKQVADQWSQNGAEVGGTCIAVDVADQSAATVAGAVSREHSATLVGLGTGFESVQVPDVWIPDSSTWLLRLRNDASGFNPSKIVPIAQSPLVVAMPEPIAQKVGWAGKKLSWNTLLAQFNSETPLQVGIVDPSRDASGLVSLLAISQAATASGEGGAERRVQALRTLAERDSKVRQELLERFPKAATEDELAGGLSAAPLSEEAVVTYNAKQPAVRLSALYVDPSPTALDYPYSIMPQVVDQQKAAAAQGLLDQLTSSAAKEALGNAGLRAADGTYGSTFKAPLGAPQASPAITPSAGKPGSGGTAASGVDGAALSSVVGSWIATTLPGRALAVFDVSGSMSEPVPTANGLSKAKVTQQAARSGLALFGDDWQVGVWRFATNLDGELPYKQLERIQPLTVARDRLDQSINRLDPVEGGGTGLYNTVLAAYKHVKDGYQGGRINSVILFTDGEDDNANGLTRAQLLAALKKEYDPKKPVRLVLIGIGDKVSKEELQAIEGAVEGAGSFFAEDPTKITQIFAQAIGQRTATK